MSKKYKVDLIDDLAKRCEITKAEAKQRLDAVLASIIELTEGEGLTIANFGTFKYKTRAAHEGHNPITMEKIHIPESTRMHFKATRYAKKD